MHCLDSGTEDEFVFWQDIEFQFDSKELVKVSFSQLLNFLPHFRKN